MVQVGQAVTPMEQATPQNAALVEEIAASSLKAQALAQRMAVLRFNLGKRLLTAACVDAVGFTLAGYTSLHWTRCVGQTFQERSNA